MVNINIIDKMKNQIGMWRISRYTKRRTYVTIEGDQPYYPHEDGNYPFKIYNVYI